MGFHTSQVVQDFSHQQYVLVDSNFCYDWILQVAACFFFFASGVEVSLGQLIWCARLVRGRGGWIFFSW